MNRAFDKYVADDHIDAADDKYDSKLWYYNLACIYVGMNELGKAKESLIIANEIKIEKPEKSSIGCLLKMDEKNGEIVLSEEFEIEDISSYIENSIEIIDNMNIQ